MHSSHTTIKSHTFFTLIVLLIIFYLPIAQAVGWELHHPSPTEHNLRAVWSVDKNDVFAVGESGTILHYDGNSWTAMRSGTTESLSAIWGSSSKDVFAVGHNTILHYNGRGWANISSNASTGDFTGIWGSGSNDVFVVGQNGKILHYDGDHWTVMSNDTRDTLVVFGGATEVMYLR